MIRGPLQCLFVVTVYFLVGLCVAMGLFLTPLSLSAGLGQAKEGRKGRTMKKLHCPLQSLGCRFNEVPKIVPSFGDVSEILFLELFNGTFWDNSRTIFGTIFGTSLNRNPDHHPPHTSAAHAHRKSQARILGK